jgi:hypothetical protein
MNRLARWFPVVMETTANTSVRLPLALRQALERRAARDDRSVSGQIRHLLVAASGFRDEEDGMRTRELADADELEWR